MARVDGNGAVAPTAWTAISFHCRTTASLVPARLGLAEHSPPRRMALTLRNNICFIETSVICAIFASGSDGLVQPVASRGFPFEHEYVHLD
jgi:hypothetical protein